MKQQMHICDDLSHPPNYLYPPRENKEECRFGTGHGNYGDHDICTQHSGYQVNSTNPFGTINLFKKIDD